MNGSLLRTVKYVNSDAVGVGVAGRAGVQTRVLLYGLLNEQPTRGDRALLGDQTYASPRRVEVYRLKQRGDIIFTITDQASYFCPFPLYFLPATAIIAVTGGAVKALCYGY